MQQAAPADATHMVDATGRRPPCGSKRTCAWSESPPDRPSFAQRRNPHGGWRVLTKQRQPRRALATEQRGDSSPSSGWRSRPTTRSCAIRVVGAWVPWRLRNSLRKQRAKTACENSLRKQQLTKAAYETACLRSRAWVPWRALATELGSQSFVRRVCGPWYTTNYIYI
jgi:hypothetical protein